MLTVSPLVFQPVLGITRVKLVSNWLVTLNHCTQDKWHYEATHQADDESGQSFSWGVDNVQLAILFGIKMAWALQFFVLGCPAVVTYNLSQHHAGYFEN